MSKIKGDRQTTDTSLLYYNKGLVRQESIFSGHITREHLLSDWPASSTARRDENFAVPPFGCSTARGWQVSHSWKSSAASAMPAGSGFLSAQKCQYLILTRRGSHGAESPEPLTAGRPHEKSGLSAEKRRYLVLTEWQKLFSSSALYWPRLISGEMPRRKSKGLRQARKPAQKRLTFDAVSYIMKKRVHFSKAPANLFYKHEALSGKRKKRRIL